MASYSSALRSDIKPPSVFYDAAKDRTTAMALLDKIPFWLGVSADGKSVAFDQPGREQAQAMLIENFH